MLITRQNIVNLLRHVLGVVVIQPTERCIAYPHKVCLGIFLGTENTEI